MDAKNILSHLNLLWVRWSAYEASEYRGVRYLRPAPGAQPLSYNCAEQPEALVADALELGRQLAANAPDADRLCAAFAARHGLLGLGAGKDASPFSGGDVAPCYRPVNEREYGEELERFQAEMRTLYRHFLSARGDKAPADAAAITGGLRFQLTAGTTPQLLWQTDRLLDVLRLAYAAQLTDPAAPLKVCKNCGKVYYNPHAKSEFCGTRCRNYYNVKVFREKKL